jgi:hypothetical protein
MNCFNHRTVTALGICRSCGKALCAECVVEMPNAVSCKGECEARNKMLNSMMNENAKIATTTNTNIRSASVFRIIFGLAFVVFGAWCYARLGKEMGVFFIAMGGLLIVFGLYFMRRRTQYPTATP